MLDAGDGYMMLRESRGDHRRLSLLTIFFHFRVTQTGIASGTVRQATLRASFCVRPNTTYKLYTISNIMVGKKFEYNTYNSLRSTP